MPFTTELVQQLTGNATLADLDAISINFIDGQPATAVATYYGGHFEQFNVPAALKQPIIDSLGTPAVNATNARMA